MTNPSGTLQSASWAGSVDHGFFDSILKGPAGRRKNEQHILPALQEESEDVTSSDILPNIVEGGHHPILDPRTTLENVGDPVNQHLLEREQRVVEAAGTILGLELVNNNVSVQHYLKIILGLREKLLQGWLDKVHFKKEHALVLARLVERLVVCPVREDREYIPHSTFVPYSRPRDYVECLAILATDMAEGLVKMQRTGAEDDVYISKNLEIHTDHLYSLSSRLLRS